MILPCKHPRADIVLNWICRKVSRIKSKAHGPNLKTIGGYSWVTELTRRYTDGGLGWFWGGFDYTRSALNICIRCRPPPPREEWNWFKSIDNIISSLKHCLWYVHPKFELKHVQTTSAFGYILIVLNIRNIILQSSL